MIFLLAAAFITKDCVYLDFSTRVYAHSLNTFMADINRYWIPRKVMDMGVMGEGVVVENQP